MTHSAVRGYFPPVTFGLGPLRLDGIPALDGNNLTALVNDIDSSYYAVTTTASMRQRSKVAVTI